MSRHLHVRHFGKGEELCEKVIVARATGFGMLDLPYTQRKVGVDGATLGGREADQPANTTDVNRLEGIFLKDTHMFVVRNEFASIITTDTHGHLRQVVGTIGEEVTKNLAVFGVL